MANVVTNAHNPKELEKGVQVGSDMMASLKIQNEPPTPETRMSSWKQWGDGRLTLLKALRAAIPVLESDRENIGWQDILISTQATENMRNDEHQVERDLVPRIRQHILQVSDLFLPSRLEEVLSSKNAEAYTPSISLIATDSTQLKTSVTEAWKPTNNSKKDNYAIQPYSYPDLPMDVDQIRDDLVKLFEGYITLLKEKNPPTDEYKGTTLHELLESVDRLHEDLKDQTRVLRNNGHTNSNRDGIIKLSKSPSSQRRLTYKMSTADLNKLYLETEGVEEDLRKFTTMILERQISTALSQFDAFVVYFDLIIKTIENHLSTLRSSADKAFVRDASLWCLMWKIQYRIAIRNFAPKHR
ncbi:hypothetical protein KEM48_003076 [Puccinia striiformis f. sp. tritici PST-130]|nr:hypothetical protein KEM48_003076 [Puccinia striiformis f. sp. tritici PST-130]